MMSCKLVLGILLYLVASVSSQDISRAQQDEENRLKIRLRAGSGYAEGRVEVQHDGEWGTICDDDWDLKGAIVVCKMLGFDGALEFVHSGKFGPGEGPILMDNVHCGGEEASLADCEHRGYGINDCSHHEDAGVKCNVQRLPQYLMKTWTDTASFDQLRLKPPRGTKKRMPQVDGYVEIFSNERWRRICSDGWNHANARVVCGQLGFPGAADIQNMYQHIKKPRKNFHYWLTNVTCVGDETRLEECSYDTLNYTGLERCPTNQAVVVRCVPGPSYTSVALKKSIKNAKRKHHHEKSERPTKSHQLIRLKSGASVGEGRLEVMRDGRWGAVCHRGWDMRDANVACRQLGFGTAKRMYTNSYFGMGHGPIWISGLSCHGNESKLDDCPHTRISEHYIGYGAVDTDECTHFEEAGIACHVPSMQITDRVRIVGGRNPMEGRVEVQMGRKWGPVCSDSWGAKEAIVVCRQLGLGFALHALVEVWYYPGSEDASNLMMTGVQCKGDEMALQFCKHDGKNLRKCGDSKRTMTPFAGVICTEGSPDLITDIPMLQDSIHMEDVGLNRLICAAEENCLSSSADGVDLRYTYGHRRLLRFSSRIWNRGRADFRPARLPADWEWHTCHGHFHSMSEFTHYDILSLNKTKVAEGHKASFCLEDSHCDPEVEKRYDCDQPGGGTQGITVGCSDTYLYNIDCQWIDITDMEKGNYLFKIHVNPNHLVPESDFTNNEVICNMQYNGHEIFLWNCHISSDYDPLITEKFYTEAMYP